MTKVYPLLKLRVFVDDITELLKESNKELAEMASVTVNGKEGKSKIIASCGYLKEQLR